MPVLSLHFGLRPADVWGIEGTGSGMSMSQFNHYVRVLKALGGDD